MQLVHATLMPLRAPIKKLLPLGSCKPVCPYLRHAIHNQALLKSLLTSQILIAAEQVAWVRPPVMLRAATSEAFHTGVEACWYGEKSVSICGSPERTPTTALVTLLARLQLTSGVLALMSMALEYISAMSWPCRCIDRCHVYHSLTQTLYTCSALAMLLASPQLTSGVHCIDVHGF